MSRAEPFVKVCGLSTAQDVQVAVEHGADAIGFVLTTSAREVSPQQAAQLATLVPEGIATVAVFHSEKMPTVLERASEAQVGWVQLHGQRSAQDVQAAHAAGFKVIRAVRRDAEPEQFADWGEDFLLIDASVPGSGESWDYAAVRELASGRQWLVAGGLNPHNVVEALALSQATGADVSSGVESSRGVKDPALIAQFIDAAKGH
ncbi:phosphoribosylanthranilate isomerase [Arthrobacter sp. NIO-1057]|uniref:phosphoribosylanthranilate isomerase n=1 Tax=Arthrobacter sp. NIO-1057 TaxID=993071 RepID=UPI00071C54D2|nr:phosphoribosylanthranilate isomerase [Arthrobacter sp. NIO-1057]KSU64214.1 phosphoribosylanthranilate isomerase [Arthrobacter sp. NIO-1057]SCC52344.1 phosphoribosylanthranilate isomerase [Arthrobacter sp. NIO-1057]